MPPLSPFTYFIEVSVVLHACSTLLSPSGSRSYAWLAVGSLRTLGFARKHARRAGYPLHPVRAIHPHPPLWHLVRDVPRQLYVQSVGAALGRGILRRPARRDLRLLHRASARARVTWPGGMSLGRVIRIMTSLMCDDCYSTEPATSSGYTSTPAHSPTRRATDTAISGSCGRLWPSTRSSYSVGQEQRHAGSFMVCSS
jgi:hypothetical protein